MLTVRWNELTEKEAIMFERFTPEGLLAYIKDRELVLVQELETLRAARRIFDEAPPANRQGAHDALAILAAMDNMRGITDKEPDLYPTFGLREDD